MIGTIVFSIFGVMLFFWLLLSILTIFFLIKYNGLSLTVWIVIIGYFLISLPIVVSGITTAATSKVKWDFVRPSIFFDY
ncbi:hypothetical protein HY622_00345 [Candidatus Uhrbacteria bacterium]|nr:hypothetical protein [Candidatus Uhrbacteria bacterium]